MKKTQNNAIIQEKCSSIPYTLCLTFKSRTTSLAIRFQYSRRRSDKAYRGQEIELQIEKLVKSFHCFLYILLNTSKMVEKSRKFEGDILLLLLYFLQKRST